MTAFSFDPEPLTDEAEGGVDRKVEIGGPDRLGVGVGQGRGAVIFRKGQGESLDERSPASPSVPQVKG